MGRENTSTEWDSDIGAKVILDLCMDSNGDISALRMGLAKMIILDKASISSRR